MTPAPTPTHETVCVRLRRILDRYVESEKLGVVYTPRAVLQFEDSEVEPDLMVRQPHSGDSNTWSSAPIPSLVVEVFSPTTKRRDLNEKRDLYMEAGVSEYWIVDPERRVFIVIANGRENVIIANGRENVIVADVVTWHPAGVSQPLVFDVAAIFG